jgi:hypothetical protein
LVTDLLDAIRTGDVNVRDYILVLHPEHYNTLLVSLRSAAIRDGAEADPRFFGFEIRVDPSVPREQITIIRRVPQPIITPRALEFNLDDLQREFVNQPLGFFHGGPHLGMPAFISNLAPEVSQRPPRLEPSVPPQLPKTLWEHLDAPWDDE